MHPPKIRTGGYCRRCKREHWLGLGNTREYCRQLTLWLEKYRSIAIFSDQSPGATHLATDWLFGPARGKMFGILECEQADGATTRIYAFSGQYNGSWMVEGWAPPLFDVKAFLALSETVEPQIKALSAEINNLKEHDGKWLNLRKNRHLLSQKLTSDLEDLYRLTNFRGETAGLREVFVGSGGIPTGTGDCCAPKLLNYAARHQLRPIGLSEFFWGQENGSGSRQHGLFSGSCREKCMPILGFMLCGLDE